MANEIKQITSDQVDEILKVQKDYRHISPDNGSTGLVLAHIERVAGQPRTLVTIDDDSGYWMRPILMPGHIEPVAAFQAWLGDTILEEYVDEEVVLDIAKMLQIIPEEPDPAVIDAMAMAVKEDYEDNYSPPYDVDFSDYSSGYPAWFEDYKNAGGAGIFTNEDIRSAVEEVFENDYRDQLTPDDAVAVVNKTTGPEWVYDEAEAQKLEAEGNDKVHWI